MEKKPRVSRNRLVSAGLAFAFVLSGPILGVAAQGSASPEPTAAADEELLVTDDETQDDVLTLPLRPGPSPSVTEGIPHIQQDQVSTPETMEALAEWVFALGSVVELPSAASLPGARGLTLAEEFEANEDAFIVGREFAHIHANPGTGSLHLRLPEDEANTVIDAGWGVRHPFAVDGSMPGLIMVFAPRDEADLEVIQLIIAASVEHAGS